MHKRVFHGLHNVAGIPGQLARAERRLGFDSRAVAFGAARGAKDVDETIRGSLVRYDLLKTAIDTYDIFNFHFGYSFMAQSLRDLPLLKARGKKVIMHFHGCDIRNSKIVLQRHEISACAVCWPVGCNANRVHARAEAARHADAIMVSTPDLLEFIERAEWLPQAVDADALRQVAAAARVKSNGAVGKDGPIRIVHAPSSSKLKGSVYLEAAVDELRREGYDLDLRLLTGRPHEEVLRAIATADVAVDQLLIGAYGVMAIEAMGLGKPTLAYIRDDVRAVYPGDLPIISASPIDIADQLRKLIAKRSEWASIGCASVAYVERVHDAARVALRLANHY